MNFYLSVDIFICSAIKTKAKEKVIKHYLIKMKIYEKLPQIFFK